MCTSDGTSYDAVTLSGGLRSSKIFNQLARLFSRHSTPTLVGNRQRELDAGEATGASGVDGGGLKKGTASDKLSGRE